MLLELIRNYWKMRAPSTEHEAITKYNITYSGTRRSMKEVFKQGLFHCKRAFTQIMTSCGLYFCRNIAFFLVMIFGFTYVISPVDLLPELVFGIFGLVDDFAVLAIMTTLMGKIHYNYEVQKEKKTNLFKEPFIKTKFTMS